MITAADLAKASTPAFVNLLHRGEDRPVLGVEVVEAEGPALVDRGDVVVAVGARTVDEAVALIDAIKSSAGLVLRRTWAEHEDVRRRCAETGLPLLAVPDDAAWSVVLNLLRSAAESVAVGGDRGPAANHIYSDLFGMADKISGMVEAPITIEDATSRVLAYSAGQDAVDEARMSSIVGRRVPREVRDHFRSLGVFRRLARSDDPFFVPAAGANDVRARYVVPVRAGGEWLGSIWAVVEEPLSKERRPELQAAAQVVALFLLRLRAYSELHRQVRLDRVRSALRGAASDTPTWLGQGPWRVAALGGPADLSPEARCELWIALTRRHGWREPLIAAIDETVYVIVNADTGGPGSWGWLADVVRTEWLSNPSIRMFAGRAVGVAADLERSCSEAAELSRIDPANIDQPVASVDASWAAVVLDRAVGGLAPLPLISPLVALVDAAAEGERSVLTTLEAVIDYWGEPRRAALSLGVHPNTIRYRVARLVDRYAVDLDDPAQRLAIRLELARLRTTGSRAAK